MGLSLPRATVRQAPATRQQTLAHNVAAHRLQVGGFAKDRSDALLASFRSRRCGGGRNSQRNQKGGGEEKAFHDEFPK